jgi:amino acid transporter
MAIAKSNPEQKPQALKMLAGERPRDVRWFEAAGLLFGDWGTSRLYVLGLAFLFAGRTSFWLILAMSGLILAVGWAYSQICRIYPDGGGVYAAARRRSRTLAVIGALLLFADYTVTASLSSLDAFHYFGLPIQHAVAAQQQSSPPTDGGDSVDPHHEQPPTVADKLLAPDSPGLWAIVAIAGLGLLNLLGPGRTGRFAIAAALGMVLITLLIVGAALPKLPWHDLPSRLGTLDHRPEHLWVAFVSIVLALSGVEAIANLTGVMKKPVTGTARKAIWIVTIEVAVFNVLLSICMLAIKPLDRTQHVNDMMAFLSGQYVGRWGELAVRGIGGFLLLSATNTALTDMTSVQFLMARDGELPTFLTQLNQFGVPWIPALIAASAPIIVLLVSHNLEALAALYAIGVIGAISINVSLCTIHPRLRRWYRKLPMALLGLLLFSIWVTVAATKLHALFFALIVMTLGLSARAASHWWKRRHAGDEDMLQKAIDQQAVKADPAMPKMLVVTYGVDHSASAKPAIQRAKSEESALLVCFLRDVVLSFKYGGSACFSMETDAAARKTFQKFLEIGFELKVPIIPAYRVGHHTAEMLVKLVETTGCKTILLDPLAQGRLRDFRRRRGRARLKSILPPDVKIEILEGSSGEQ